MTERYEQILCDTDGDVMVLTLNRPDKMNAWTPHMSAELSHAITTANDDPSIGAIVITGEGRGFCAGADIGAVFAEQQETGERQGDAGNWVELLRKSKPIITAVNGPSIGVGATMILPTDIIVASTKAKFGFAFVKMGVVPELASSHLLVQRLGFGRASEMCLTGRLYSATECSELGLIDRLVEPEELLPTALGLAHEIAANPAPQLRWIKELLTQNGSETDLSAVQRRELGLLKQAYESPEHKEAIQAFLDKRPPDFRAAAQRAAK